MCNIVILFRYKQGEDLFLYMAHIPEHRLEPKKKTKKIKLNACLTIKQTTYQKPKKYSKHSQGQIIVFFSYFFVIPKTIMYYV